MMYDYVRYLVRALSRQILPWRAPRAARIVARKEGEVKERHHEPKLSHREKKQGRA
jgi:hypothetical protein